jgi:hypothetical protein
MLSNLNNKIIIKKYQNLAMIYPQIMIRNKKEKILELFKIIKIISEIKHYQNINIIIIKPRIRII